MPWNSLEEDGSWVAKGPALGPRKKHQVRSDVNTDLVEMDLKDVGRKESEASHRAQSSLQMTLGDRW